MQTLSEQIAELRTLAASCTSNDEARILTSRIAQISRKIRTRTGIGLPPDPLAQAMEMDPSFTSRPHLALLSEEIADAVRDVERGQNRFLSVAMPPRSGKTQLISKQTPMWVLRRHPDWKVVLASYDGGMAASWAGDIRQSIEAHPDLGIAISPDSGARSSWSTVEQGSMFTTSIRGALTGRGARLLIIDDPVKDFIEAHSVIMRNHLWDWWLSVALTRLEPPYLVIVVMTRWHEDDLVGRLHSTEYEGNPKVWRNLSIPAISEGPGDALGRDPGEPLYSPIISETREQALHRWNDVKQAVGSYTFAAMYQQRPSPSKGAIFDSSWWKFWTTDPAKATDDGRIVFLDESVLVGAQWVDSWDCAFGQAGAERGGWVVGQRWMRHQDRRYLMHQVRGRWNFTETLAEMTKWSRNDDHVISPWGDMVFDRLIEAKANGAAIIEVMKEHISGIKGINPTVSKEARARAVTPEIESGHVYLPLPSDIGHEWVLEFLSEMRNFPHDVSDDQVDTLTQALSYLRSSGGGRLTVPGSPSTMLRTIPRNVATAARTDLGRRRS